ncbi:MAG: S49 family peptidase, partial [Spirochaetia bacterium]|nr:S49 family peptidase [Spirochaetia bacterium]
EGSVVGSIGVIAFHPNVSGFLNQHGVTVTPLKAGRFKDSSYPFRDMTQEERDMEQRVLDDAYQMFLKDVAEGRGQPLSTVGRWAEGRIYSGKAALLEQMVSNTGGRDDAVIEIKRMLKTSRDLPILEPKREFLDDLFDVMPFGGKARRMDTGSLGTIYYLHPAGLPPELVDFVLQIGR